jgi:hypothetical protein
MCATLNEPPRAHYINSNCVSLFFVYLKERVWHSLKINFIQVEGRSIKIIVHKVRANSLEPI